MEEINLIIRRSPVLLFVRLLFADNNLIVKAAPFVANEKTQPTIGG